MKVEMLTVGAGDLTFRPGDVLELSEAIAKPYLDAGVARKVGQEIAATPKEESKPKKPSNTKAKSVSEAPDETPPRVSE